MENLMEDVAKFEPHSALTDFNDGLTFYRKFVDISTKILNPKGWFIVEVGLGKHPQKVLEMFSTDKFINIELVKDLNGDNRVLKAQLA
jgi:methylase of polypeptide subunit release factors